MALFTDNAVQSVPTDKANKYSKLGDAKTQNVNEAILGRLTSTRILKQIHCILESSQIIVCVRKTLNCKNLLSRTLERQQLSCVKNIKL